MPFPIWLWIMSVFLPLGWLPLFDVDEGAFSEATREMLQSGNYLTTYLYGVLRFDKPILIYWLQALSAHLFGLTTWAMRLPSACVSSLWLWAMYRFVLQVYGSATAWRAVWLFVAAIQISIIAKTAIADALLNTTLVVSMFSFWWYLKKKEHVDLYTAFFAMGLGVLAKGPIALLIPLGVISLYALSYAQGHLFVNSFLNVRAWGVFLLIALPWYVLEWFDQGWLFIDGFFLTHNVNRALSAMESHQGAWWYYIPVVIFGLCPFSGFLYPVLRQVQSIWQQDVERFLWIWVCFVLGVFSCVSTKLPHYVIYAYTPLIILMARYAKEQWHHSLYMLPALILWGVFSLLPWLFSWIASTSHDPALLAIAPGISKHFAFDYQIVLHAPSLVVLYIWYRDRWRDIRHALVACWCLGFVHIVFLPRLVNVLQRPVYDAAMLAKSMGDDVVMYRMHNPSFAFYSGLNVTRAQPQAGNLVLTRSWYQQDFAHVEIVYSQYGVVLLRLLK